ncbi:ATP-binding protein [Mucilaginibacter sp. SMC90]|uniref:CheR family methyltransferase n=1 Tax=Mucilaginibacter sp. SMC90 TaxID=2929803 RepID=UPI001FB4E7B6|nr:CheR family methyltransferase [Mucilaginibacter sp. SMC90]UOE48820.1 ATP-binding protein [Mucilaginibacter sp. SMC90]
MIKNGITLNIKIFATDINQHALNQASRGIYKAQSLSSVSAERKQSFFDEAEFGFKIKPEIRSMLVFAQHDLTRNPPYCNLDLISCRNMLIYVKPSLQKIILSKFTFGLKKHAFLFLGSSENISGFKDDYTEISAKWNIYQRTDSIKKFGFESYLPPALTGINFNGVQKSNQSPQQFSSISLAPDLSELILLESGYCGVSTDEELKVLQAYGDLSLYLKKEFFNNNLPELLPEPLMLALRAAAQKALLHSERQKISGIVFSLDDSKIQRSTNLIVSPFIDKKSRKRGLLILFEGNHAISESDLSSPFDMDKVTKEHIEHLESELIRLKEELQTANDYLESSQESMQAYNEELLSANEEMQSANEEMQSINEELESINNEHKYTIQELTSVNNDLNNYFRNNANSQLIVDRDLLLKKYSPGAVKHINIQEGDIGRPLSNITTNIKLETILDDIRKVISSGETIMREVESLNGNYYHVLTSPYIKQKEKIIDGAIISFYNVTELRNTRKELDHSNNILRLATESAEMATWSINLGTMEFIPSPRLKKLFGFNVDEDMSLEMSINQISVEYRSLFSEAMADTMASDKKFELEFSLRGYRDGDLRWIRAIGNVSPQIVGETSYFIGFMHDISEQKLNDIRKYDFIAMASHELKTPLTAIEGSLKLLTGNLQDTETNAFALKNANIQLKRMFRLVNGFLNVSKISVGNFTVNRNVFEIGALIRESFAEVKLLASNHIINFHPASLIEVVADREKIGQVINNILSNAVKFSPEQSTIEINYRKTKGYLEVSVKDNGMGIKSHDLPKLFERFYRIENVPTQVIPGFGIGLYMSAEIIRLHKGKIWAESEFGKGSIFSFMIPLNPEGLN